MRHTHRNPIKLIQLEWYNVSLSWRGEVPLLFSGRLGCSCGYTMAIIIAWINSHTRQIIIIIIIIDGGRRRILFFYWPPRRAVDMTFYSILSLLHVLTIVEQQVRTNSNKMRYNCDSAARK